MWKKPSTLGLALGSCGIIGSYYGITFFKNQKKNNSQNLQYETIDGFRIPKDFACKIDAIKKFRMRDDDVIVASFPKSGTTWLQEIVFLLLTRLDTAAGMAENMESRFPYLEYPWPGLDDLEHRSSQRFIKTHLPFSLLPDECLSKNVKIIYIARNVKDVVTSYYFFARMFIPAGFDGNMTDFVKRFLRDDVAYCPWSDHLISYQQQKDKVLFLTYESLQKNPIETIQRIAKFLGISDEFSLSQYETIAHRCSFEFMKHNPATNYSWWDHYGLRRKGESQFFRKGVVGDHVNHLSAQEAADLDQLMHHESIQNCFTNSHTVMTSESANKVN